jgi:hypothetical protein
MTELRYKLRLSTLEVFPEFKPILDKISVRVRDAIADSVLVEEFSDENFLFNVDLYAGQQLIANLGYGELAMGMNPRSLTIQIKDAQIDTLASKNPSVTLANFKDLNTFSILLLEGYPLLSVLQKLIKSLLLEESISVVTFAKFLSILFPACAIVRRGDEDLAYQEERLHTPQVVWNISSMNQFMLLWKANLLKNMKIMQPSYLGISTR